MVRAQSLWRSLAGSVRGPDHGVGHPMCLSVQGKRTDAPEHRGVRGLRHHAECLQVADVVIEATW